MNRFRIAVLTVAAALGGLLLTFANRWGADDPGFCRDTVINVIASCVAPQSPVWALLLGALLPASAVAALAAFWVRRSGG